MTVLSKYQRLECAGIWHPSADAQRKDVFVALGDASLIIKDANDSALAHWSLPAVTRTNPGARPAHYSPGPDADELLELDDDTMIDAIRTVGRALGKARARPGRLRRAVLLVSALAVWGLGAWWLPGALTRHTASLVPEGLRGEIGQRLLRELTAYAGAPCAGQAGLSALAQLRDRVLDEDGWSVAVVPSGPALSAHLPGRLIVLRSDAIEGQQGPALAAGLILAEVARARARDPMLTLIEDLGLRATFTLLTRGAIADEALRGYAAGFLVQPPAALPPGALAAHLRAADLPPAVLDAARAPTASDTPAARTRPAAGLMPDGTWLELRGICES